jgi:hypothetical protein
MTGTMTRGNQPQLLRLLSASILTCRGRLYRLRQQYSTRRVPIKMAVPMVPSTFPRITKTATPIPRRSKDQLSTWPARASFPQRPFNSLPHTGHPIAATFISIAANWASFRPKANSKQRQWRRKRYRHRKLPKANPFPPPSQCVSKGPKRRSADSSGDGGGVVAKAWPAIETQPRSSSMGPARLQQTLRNSHFSTHITKRCGPVGFSPRYYNGEPNIISPPFISA